MTNTVSRTVSDETLNCIITIESAGNPNAKARTSTATGLFQFIAATWIGTVQKHRPDLMRGRDRNEVLALRTDPKLAIELGARFTEDNQRAIGMDCTGGDLYLAHFLGVADARDLFRADPSTPVAKLVSESAIRSNEGILRHKTAGEVRAWAARKMMKAGGKNWIAKFMDDEPEQPVPMPKPRPETAEDIPDPQDAPKTPLPEPTVVVPKEAPPEVIERQIEESAERDAEPGGSWLKRQWKKLTGAAGGFIASATGFVLDWKLAAVFFGAIFFFAVCIILFMGPGRVREWIRKQVS